KDELLDKILVAKLNYMNPAFIETAIQKEKRVSGFWTMYKINNPAKLSDTNLENLKTKLKFHNSVCFAKDINSDYSSRTYLEKYQVRDWSKQLNEYCIDIEISFKILQLLSTNENTIEHRNKNKDKGYDLLSFEEFTQLIRDINKHKNEEFNENAKWWPRKKFECNKKLDDKQSTFRQAYYRTSKYIEKYISERQLEEILESNDYEDREKTLIRNFFDNSMLENIEEQTLALLYLAIDYAKAAPKDIEEDWYNNDKEINENVLLFPKEILIALDYLINKNKLKPQEHLQAIKDNALANKVRQARLQFMIENSYDTHDDEFKKELEFLKS
ncbi:MAG: hypothetical protein MJ189_03565, partial [Coriobacteriales bacterium]|nr:hypothetical protein [Coriobacteriales bacterium]